MALAVRLPETPSTPSEQLVALIESQITAVESGRLNQGARVIAAFQPGSQITAGPKPWITIEAHERDDEVHHRQLVLGEAAAAVVEVADRAGRRHQRQRADRRCAGRHEDQRRETEDGDEDQPGAHRLADARLGVHRERAAAVLRQVVPEPRQQDPGRERGYGEPDAGQEEERVEQPQRPEVAAERAVQPAQHGRGADSVVVTAILQSSRPKILQSRRSPARWMWPRR